MRLTFSVLICTRNRPASLVRAVQSLLRSNGPFELLVIDQSEGDETRKALDAFRDDARLRHVPSRVLGKGAALNQGLMLASAPIVVCTDDDCEANPSWAAQMSSTIDAHPRVAVLFCNVVAATHDVTLGYVPAFVRPHDRLLSSILDARHGIGLGAGMALRRDAVLGFGGFDESFGPGGRFRSGDDWDISLRAMLTGWHVYETAQLSILHHGFRTMAEGREHALRDWIAIGALCAKPVRAGYLSALILSFWYFAAEAVWPPLRDLLQFRRPSGRSRIVGFVQGFLLGVKIPVDRKTLLFQVHPAR